ncbi:ANTAR domain-containing protein [Jatrophihabitans sp. YIM 134969]
MSVVEQAQPAPEQQDVELEPAWGVLERLGRSLHVKEAGLQATLTAILETAVEVVAPATAAGVNLLVRGVFQPQAVLGEAPHRLDSWQQERGAGPCIDASAEQAVLVVDDTATEARWPGFGTLAVECGVGSMLCVPLWVDTVSLGSVSLYAAEAAAFSRFDERLAGLLATQAALALSDAQRTEQLRTMAANRDLIGQAKGILMERHKLTADQAFDQLRTASQQSNRKLVEVADTVVMTGTLG